jgi:hypothetical protein
MNKNKFKETMETVEAGTVNSDCNTITILNISASAVMTVNGVPISPGTAYLSEGTYLDENTTKYNLQFTPSDGTGQAVVIRKMYI